MAWTDISNASVAAGAAVTTGLVTALRDNVSGLAARDTGAPKILGNPYDYQEFLTSGTWTKPSNAESGDVVVVQIVGGGASGERSNSASPFGGGGAAGAFHRYDIDAVGATEAIVVGAGAAGGSGSGSGGGTSTFGTRGTASGVAAPYLSAQGGRGGDAATENDGGLFQHGTLNATVTEDFRTSQIGTVAGGDGGANDRTSIGDGQPSVFGGGGGGRASGSSVVSGPYSGGFSCYAGSGGDGTQRTGSIGDVAIDGEFPGGGGGAVQTDMTGDTVSGAGADGVVRVWCIKEQ